MTPLLLLLLACTKAVDPGGPVIDLHTHCPDPAGCDPTSVEAALDGQLTVVGLSVSHFAIADTLGDPMPAELADLPVEQGNAVHRDTGAQSPAIESFASLDCLRLVPVTDPDFVATCLDDADRLLAEGHLGFKDHAGKTFEGGDLDVGRWVGAFNRLAGFCDPGAVSAPNQACMTEPGATFPLALDPWRELVRGLVEEREVPLVTHAVPWHGADDVCWSEADPEASCHDVAADALVDFAHWAEAELSPEARRRVVVAHLGFLQDDPDRLLAVLDAGLSVDLAQTDFTAAGCDLRDLVARYPDQVVAGTDMELGLDCIPNHWDAWSWALLGKAGKTRTFRNTCRGTLRVVGAALADPDACGIEVPEGAARKVLHDNAAALLGR